MIRVDSLTKAFKGIHAVTNVSFSVEKGEVLGLLGENGAGKTTTMRMMATILKPSSGDVVIDGFSVTHNQHEVRQRIGLLFGGDVGLYSRLTARENIAYFGKLYGMDREALQKRISSLSQMLGMEDYIDRRVGPFSRGMRQKVAIARAIVHDPMVILFDEPTTGLDITAANVFRKLILTLQKEGKTILFSSHNMGEIERLCQRIVIMHKGVIKLEGTISELKKTFGTEDMDDIFMKAVGGERQ